MSHSSVPYSFQCAGTAIARCPILVFSSVQEQLLLGVPNNFQFAGTAIYLCHIIVSPILSSVEEQLLIDVPFYCP